MVLRNSTPQQNIVPPPLSQAVNNPPYPVTPSTEEPPSLPDQPQVYSPDLNKSPAFNFKTLDEAQKKKKAEDDADSNCSMSDWEQSDDDSGPEDLPAPLKIGGGKTVPAPANKAGIPDVLKSGPPPGMAIQKSPEKISPEPTGASAASWGGASNSSTGSVLLKTNNPYLRMQSTGQSNFGGESSQQVWGDASSQAQKYNELVELPSFQTPDTPTNKLANLDLGGDIPPAQRPKSLDQPPLIAVETPTPLQSPHATNAPQHDLNIAQPWNSGIDASAIDAFSRTYGQPAPKPTHQSLWQEQQEWGQGGSDTKQKEQTAAPVPGWDSEQQQHQNEGLQSSGLPAHIIPDLSYSDEERAPALPPRRSYEELPPPMPPRPIDTTAGSSSQAVPESPNTVMNRQRKEHYQIKHIRWLDASTRQIRTSPILTQNINGPCPLLALVNALVLSTPAGMKTEFVETLRTREQISLGLLLDAVFEELMSGRRGGAAQELPDVNDLYKFLVGLQTGLNVNPMFVQDPEATDGPSNLSLSVSARPGGFENTPDMKLYKTFNVPLLHGWLPEPGSDAYIAFDRVAKTYDSSQIIQFQEEELEAKLQTSGLSPDEQRLFTDIHVIKEFLNRWPTQLTDHGLRSIRGSVKPGQFAILFRNDHFSTLYKNPHTEELMTLVTDQGYASHDEIVWESLVDVNGQGSELYSGDFRAVGNNSLPQRQQHQPPVQNLLNVDDDQGWTTVPNGRRNDQSSSSPSSSSQNPDTLPPTHPALSRTEQEDHDLALALQLQEEEDDRQRRMQEERRRRENQLSENAIAAQSQPQSPPRPAGRRASQGNPPLIPPRRNNAPTTHRPANSNDPAPPPTYEEAATTPQYHPPQGHPANPDAPIRPPGSTYQANGGPGASSSQSGRRPARPPGAAQGPNLPLSQRPGRKQSGVVGPNDERDKCAVM